METIKRNKKKGLSPAVTTVLLIVMIVVIIGIIFLWFRGMVEEGVTKFGKNVQLVCDDVNFEASYFGGTLSISNNGNVPMYNANLRITKSDGSYTTRTAKDSGIGWPDKGLNQGKAFSGSLDATGANKITVFPILIGTTSSGKKTFICEGQYGKEISI
jgi:flagellin-like protein